MYPQSLNITFNEQSALIPLCINTYWAMTVKSDNVVNIGDGVIAFSALSAVVNMSDRLRRAIDNAVVTGDYSLLEWLVGVIESWANGNEEERRAYKLFMGRYKSLYKRAKRLLEERWRKTST